MQHKVLPPRPLWKHAVHEREKLDHPLAEQSKTHDKDGEVGVVDHWSK